MARLISAIFIALLVTSFPASAQIFSGTAPSVKWNQVNTTDFRVIYPKGLDSVAKRISSVIQYVSPFSLPSIGTKTKKVDIILRNNGLVSNGYVSLAPFRSEFYLTPPQNLFSLGSRPWPDLLTAHEYRHVQQDANYNVRLSHVFKIIFGQEGQIFANSGAVPDWFDEGDAVYVESSLSRQGRGSLPYFYKDFKALWATGKKYSWAKLRNGSYMDFVPDKYILGFMMVAYGREKFGNDFWEKVTHDAASYKPLFYPFQGAIKKYSGEDYTTFRKNAFDFFKNQLPDSLPKPAPDYYLNEYNPSYNSDGDLIYLSGSVKKIQAFYKKSNSVIRRIRTADNMVDDYFQLHGNKILYASLRPDIRWGYKSYNDIVEIDLTTGRQKTITKKTRYFSPAFNDKEDKIVAVNSNSNSTTNLHILDANTGKILKEINEPDILNYSYPVFYGDRIISCVSGKNGKTSLLLINTENWDSEYLLPFTNNVVGWPSVQNDTLYFSYSLKKDDCLFAITLKDKKIWRVSLPLRGTGIYQFAAGSDSVSFSTFTAQGFRINSISKKDLSFNKITTDQLEAMTTSFGLTKINAKNPNIYRGIPDTSFTTKKYSPFTHPFNFHSIEPDVNDPLYSLSLLGENVLSTITSQITFTYNRSDRSKQIGAGFNYGRWFPVLAFGANYQIDNWFLNKDTAVFYNSLEPYAGFYVPLNFSKGRSLTGLNFGSSFRYNSSKFQKPFQKRFRDFSYSYINNYISFANQSMQSTAQVQPRFMQTLFLNYKFPVSGVSGYQYLASAGIYLPGFAPTHSFNFAVAYSRRDTMNEINFSNPFPFARGYEGTNSYSLKGIQINYQLPLCYPETGIAQIVYFSRIRGNVFFDLTRMKQFINHNFFNREFKSSGIELFFDTRWWNQSPVSFGIRYSRLFDRGVLGETGNQWEFILPVNIFNK